VNIIKERQEIDAVLTEYSRRLSQVAGDQFTLTPPMGGWSYAEVYSHVLKTNKMCVIAVEQCATKKCEPSPTGPNLIGRVVLAFQRFPPIRIKVPQKVAEKSPVLKISKDEAETLLAKLRKQLDLVTPLIEGAQPAYRIRHPRLGMLNAEEWFRFIKIHSAHHIQQLNRISRDLRLNAPAGVSSAGEGVNNQ
jgi:hypothetical protein